MLYPTQYCTSQYCSILSLYSTVPEQHYTCAVLCCEHYTALNLYTIVLYCVVLYLCLLYLDCNVQCCAVLCCVVLNLLCCTYFSVPVMYCTYCFIQYCDEQ